VAKKVSSQLTKALNYAFLLLKFRKRGRRELRLRLEAKGYGQKDIEAALSYLEEKRFIAKDSMSEADEAAALARQAATKLKKLTPAKARKRIFAYLLRRGFSNEVVSETVDNI